MIRTADRRVLVFCPRASHVGGGYGVLAWMLQALADRCDLTLLTMRPVDLAALDRAFGTTLAHGRLRLEHVLSVPTGLTPFRLALLEQNAIFRFVRRRAREYDVIVSNANEADCGVRLVQYVHFPWSYMPRPIGELRWYHRGPLLRCYRHLCQRLSGFDEESLALNLSLVNSSWTGGKLTELSHGRADWVPVPPPVASNPRQRPWAERENAALILGRLSRVKRIEVAIDIVSRVRAAGEDLKLCIVGPVDEQRYARRLLRFAARFPWIERLEGLSRTELQALMGRHRYGIHAMVDEHFGMAPAEMVASRAVVFVHDSGGPREIVAADARVCWTTPEEAAAKMLAVMRDPRQQMDLSGSLQRRATEWVPERFMERIRWVIDRWPDVTGSDCRRAWGVGAP